MPLYSELLVSVHVLYVYIQVCSNSDLEDILNSVSSGLRNCLVAVHNVESYSVGNDVEAMCITCGAICSRIVMVTSVFNNESECAVGCPIYSIYWLFTRMEWDTRSLLFVCLM